MSLSSRSCQHGARQAMCPAYIFRPVNQASIPWILTQRALILTTCQSRFPAQTPPCLNALSSERTPCCIGMSTQNFRPFQTVIASENRKA